MTLLSAEAIAARRSDVLARIAEAADRVGRNPEEIALLAVTKTHPAALVRNAAGAGLTLFGENRVSEGISKIEALREQLPGLTWRLIGPLQTNKAKRALQYFSMVETLDRQRLVSRLESLLEAERRRFPVLLEFNLAGEPTKSGADPAQAEALAALAFDCPHLEVRGVMAVPPWTSNPEESRPYFRQLRQIRDRLTDRFGKPLPEISMGMSHDFEVAVEEGSTEVRLGTALFGDREAA